MAVSMIWLTKYPLISMENHHMLKLNLRTGLLKGLSFVCNHALSLIFRQIVSASSNRGLPLIVALVFLLQGAAPPLSEGSNELNRRLGEVVRRVLPPNFTISIQVADLATGLILMERNPDIRLIPASTMKVATSSAAFSTLKPDFTFNTEVLADKVKGSSVGDIYLRGSGDPYLVSEQLFALTRELRDKGLREIRGNIIVDDSYFIPGKPLDENERLGARSYHAPYGALSLNFNSLRILVIPGPKAGRAARVLADPESEYARVKAAVKTVRGRRKAKLSITKESTTSGGEEITVKGVIGVRAPVKSLYVNVSNPSVYTGAVFKEFVLREGIRVTGKVIRGKTPASAVSYLRFRSRPLATTIYWLNKFSNNFMAEQLSLAMGAAVHGVPGTREKGLSVIRGHLLSLGVDEGSFSLSEASGLSRKNRLSASALVRVLLASGHQFSYNAEFISSLGIAGVDGTLK